MHDGRYEKKVKDYNFGSLIRTDARQEYSETNTIFVTRIQVRRSLPPPRSLFRYARRQARTAMSALTFAPFLFFPLSNCSSTCSRSRATAWA